MKRIPIPPTRYDPMRPVQAKMAAPMGGPGAAIPPTRYGPTPVQPRMAGGTSGSAAAPPTSHHLGQGRARPIQRAAAAVAAGQGAGQIVADYQTAKAGDTMAMTYLRTLGQAALLAHLDAKDAIIGSDKPASSDIREWLELYKLRSLSAHLVATGNAHDKAINAAWVDACVKARRRFFVVGEHGLYTVRSAAGAAKPHWPKAQMGNTSDEVEHILANRYVWSEGYQMLVPKESQVVAMHAAAANANAAAAKPPVKK